MNKLIFMTTIFCQLDKMKVEHWNILLVLTSPVSILMSYSLKIGLGNGINFCKTELCIEKIQEVKVKFLIFNVYFNYFDFLAHWIYGKCDICY